MDRIVVEVDEIGEYDFWQFLDGIGKKAEANGLTEDQLNKPLYSLSMV